MFASNPCRSSTPWQSLAHFIALSRTLSLSHSRRPGAQRRGRASILDLIKTLSLSVALSLCLYVSLSRSLFLSRALSLSLSLSVSPLVLGAACRSSQPWRSERILPSPPTERNGYGDVESIVKSYRGKDAWSTMTSPISPPTHTCSPRTSTAVTYPAILGPLGYDVAQHRPTPRPSVERIRREALFSIL